MLQMKKIQFGLKALVGALSLVSSAYTVASGCPGTYPSEKPIRVSNAVELCNSFYASNYDVNNRAVVFTTEVLRKGAPVGSGSRLGSFKADSRLNGKSPRPEDYTNSGYDRGHMVPSDDSSNMYEMSETFVMTNAVPQDPMLNRGSWKSMEEGIRKEFQTSAKNVWVLTIPVYNKGGYMNNIPIPTGIWKIVYGNTVKYYFADNKPGGKVTLYPTVSVESILANSRNF